MDNPSISPKKPAAEKKRPGSAAVAAAMSLAFVIGCAWILLNVFSFSLAVSDNAALERDLIAEYQLSATNFKSTALDGIYSIRRIYMIPETQVTAPEPDEALFGSAGSMSELEAVAAKAEEYGLVSASEIVAVAEGTPVTDGQPIEYYLDETILTVTWKTIIGDEVVNFTEAVIGHPSQFRKYLTNNEFGSGKRKTVSAMSKEINAVVGMSADFYAYRQQGVVVQNGQVHRSKVANLDNCYIDSNGNLLFAPRGTMKADELEQYVADNSIRFSLSFGPILIRDGQIDKNVGKDYRLGQVLDNYSRAGIGQLGELHYLLCTIDGGAYSAGKSRDGTTVTGLAKIMHSMGCVNAYTLDGGQTATMTVNGKVFNKVGYGSERPVSDIIFFATAMPDGSGAEVTQ